MYNVGILSVLWLKILERPTYHAFKMFDDMYNRFDTVYKSVTDRQTDGPKSHIDIALQSDDAR